MIRYIRYMYSSNDNIRRDSEFTRISIFRYSYSNFNYHNQNHIHIGTYLIYYLYYYFYYEALQKYHKY